MKTMMLSLFCCTLLAAGIVYAADHADHAAKDAKTPTTAPTTKPVNTMCLVDTDHPIDDRAVIMFEGKAIGFCCEDCIAEFKKNPKKYLDNAK